METAGRSLKDGAAHNVVTRTFHLLADWADKIEGSNSRLSTFRKEIKLHGKSEGIQGDD